MLLEEHGIDKRLILPQVRQPEFKSPFMNESFKFLFKLFCVFRSITDILLFSFRAADVLEFFSFVITVSLIIGKSSAKVASFDGSKVKYFEYFMYSKNTMQIKIAAFLSKYVTVHKYLSEI